MVHHTTSLPPLNNCLHGCTTLPPLNICLNGCTTPPSLNICLHGCTTPSPLNICLHGCTTPPPLNITDWIPQVSYAIIANICHQKYIYIYLKVIDILITMDFQLTVTQKMKKINKAYLNTIFSRSVSSGLHSSFWKLFCWGMQVRQQCLLGSYSAAEGWTDTNAYWEALLQSKAGQISMLTGNSHTNAYQELFCWGRMERHQCLLGAFLLRKAGQTPSSSTEEGWTDTNAYWELFCWGRLDRCQCLGAQIPMLTSSSSAEEGMTDIYAYWEAPLLRKAGRMQYLLDRHQFFLGSSSSEKGWTYTKIFYWGRLDRHWKRL